MEGTDETGFASLTLRCRVSAGPEGRDAVDAVTSVAASQCDQEVEVVRGRFLCLYKTTPITLLPFYIGFVTCVTLVG